MSKIFPFRDSSYVPHTQRLAKNFPTIYNRKSLSLKINKPKKVMTQHCMLWSNFISSRAASAWNQRETTARTRKFTSSLTATTATFFFGSTSSCRSNLKQQDKEWFFLFNAITKTESDLVWPPATRAYVYKLIYCGFRIEMQTKIKNKASSKYLQTRPTRVGIIQRKRLVFNNSLHRCSLSPAGRPTYHVELIKCSFSVDLGIINQYHFNAQGLFCDT